MRHVDAEFDTRDEPVRDSYGDAGCRIQALDTIPMFLRHEWYERESCDRLYYFGRAPEMGSQVFINVFPGGDSNPNFDTMLSSYSGLRCDFRLPAGQIFGPEFLRPKAHGFIHHEVFRVRDGRTRRRIVHRFSGAYRSLLLIYSLDTNKFLSSPFITAVSANLHFSDVPVDAPFRRNLIIEQGCEPDS